MGTLHAGGGPAEEPGRPVPVRSRAATDLGRRLGVRSHRDRPAGTPAARRGHRLGSCVAARDAHRRRRSLRGQPRRSTVTIIDARPAEDIDEPVSSEPSTRPVGPDAGTTPPKSRQPTSRPRRPNPQTRTRRFPSRPTSPGKPPSRSPRRPAPTPSPATHPRWPRRRRLYRQPTAVTTPAMTPAATRPVSSSPPTTRTGSCTSTPPR